MSTVCSHCGGTDIEYDAGRGDAVCTSCGSVLEDNIIVSEVSFQEQSSGASAVIGQFVSTESSKVPLSGSGFHHGMGNESRVVTLQQAKRRLTSLGNMLKLNQHCIDSAFMFFKMALQLNLTRGRKSSVVDTACLYLVCRSEGTPHLLLDFSDVLQINVYALGRAYLKLANALHINPPAIDPCLYIHRFAHKLELGDKMHEVAMTAMRLVARMKRDWIHHGRRPAGLCGAALLVAARLHNFNRSVREVARVVKLSKGTIRKRLVDFKDTPSSRLTIEEFLKIDLEQEHDPPSYAEAKRRTKQQITESGEQKGAGFNMEKSKDISGNGEGGEEPDEWGRGFGGIVMRSVQDIIAKARVAESMANVPTVGLTDQLDDLVKLGEEEDVSAQSHPESKPEEQAADMDLADIDDEEIDKLLLSEDEVKIKTQLWFAENADYLKQQEIRRANRAMLAAKAEKPRKRTRRKQKGQYVQPPSSAGEAIERMLVEKKISTKINYDVLRDLDKGVASEPLGPLFPATKPVISTGLGGLTSFANPTPTPEVTTSSSLSITRPPSMSRGRLPSLSTRKRTFSDLSGGSPSGGTSKIPRSLSSTESSLHQAKSESTRQRILGLVNQDGVSTPSLPQTSGASSNSLENKELRETQSQLPTRTELATKASISKGVSTVSHQGAVGLASGEPTAVAGNPDVVEESGPVEYSDEEEDGLDDEEMQELAYEGDPLLHSDYEEDANDDYEDDDYNI